MIREPSADFTIRPWLPSDLQDLREIQSVSFGDPPEITAAFHRAFLNRPEACIVAAVPEEGRPEGRAVCSIYCLPGPVLRCAQEGETETAYVYALGTKPAWRHKGIGLSVFSEKVAQSLKEALVSCMIPATEELALLYCKLHPMSPLGSSRIAEMSAAQVRAADPPEAERIPWETYALLREECLAGRPHASYPESWYSLSAEFGNVYLRLPGALAAVIPLEDRCIVTELLCPETDPARTLAGAAAACPAEQYTVRTPVFFPGPGEVRHFAWYVLTERERHFPDDFWLPFGLE